MKSAALISEKGMKTAMDIINPGIRQCDAIAEIQRLENNPEDLLKILNANPFHAQEDVVTSHQDAARDFLMHILEQPLELARRRPTYGRVLMLEKKRRSDQTGWKKKLRRNRF